MYLKKIKELTTLLLLFFIIGCAYYNTFFNAEENYRIGLVKNEEAKLNKSSRKNPAYFKTAITKSWKVINQYGDSSSWADDALFLIGKSHYQLEEYDKARKIFEQFLKKYLKSEYIPNVQLWLGKTYLNEDKPEKALKIYSDILESNGTDEIKAKAHANLGDLYFASDNYDAAIENYNNCLALSNDSKLRGATVYKLGDSYFKAKKYKQATDSYKLVLQSDSPIIRQFSAMKSMIDAYLELGQKEEAQTFLKNSLHNARFKSYYSLIAAKLANIYEFQGEYDFAMENYHDVLKTYPRKEGAALAAFYIAQLYEFEYGQFDSAKVYYDRVRKEYSRSEAIKEAKTRSALLAQYIKIHTSLNNDISNLYKLEHGDSSLVDSMVTGKDTIEVNISENQPAQDSSATQNDLADDSHTIENANTGIENSGFSKNDQNLKTVVKKEKKIKDKKVAISRTPDEVRDSFKKNSYKIAEYFLINYMNYDSAEFRFKNFMNYFSDSLLLPKAYYSLYFIYHTIDKDSIRADSIAGIIKTKYRDTIYGRKLLGIDLSQSDAKEEKIKLRFIQAEKEFTDKQYPQAVKLYNSIAKQDSGTVWAIKSLYAAAYISENYLKKPHQAFTFYSQLAKGYPQTDQGKIAIRKVKPLPKPKAVEKKKENPKIKPHINRKKIYKDKEQIKVPLKDDKL